jgi:glutamine amidotransferase
MISIIDYGAGNIRSVANAISHLGYRINITQNAEEIWSSGVVFFPGVGAAGDTMESLNKLGLKEIIKRLISENRPVFCICIGLQVLFTYTEEGGRYDCLNVIPGKVKKLPSGLKVPHMGWNQVKQKFNHPVFQGIPDEANFYFVHSYYGEPEDKTVMVGETEYGIPFCSAVAKGNLVATQFHPEKSGDIGLRLFENFIKLTGEKR